MERPKPKKVCKSCELRNLSCCEAISWVLMPSMHQRQDKASGKLHLLFLPAYYLGSRCSWTCLYLELAGLGSIYKQPIEWDSGACRGKNLPTSDAMLSSHLILQLQGRMTPA